MSEDGGDVSLLVIGSQWESAVLIAEDVLYMLSEKNENMIAEIVEPPATSAAASRSDVSQREARAQHIMISYSWATSKEFVVKVSAGLRKKGFDVWRDEEGSELVRKMMGSSMEIMAQAIEYADVVVIFVSRAYRDSYNCKLEGKYAQVRERAGLTKILFVMMEEDYTPESNSSVDGWLGMLIGDHIYYPGWDAEKLGETVVELSKAIHKIRKDSCEVSSLRATSSTNGSGIPERQPLSVGALSELPAAGCGATGGSGPEATAAATASATAAGKVKGARSAVFERTLSQAASLSLTALNGSLTALNGSFTARAASGAATLRGALADTIEPPLGAGAAGSQGSLPIQESLRPHPRLAVPDMCLGLKACESVDEFLEIYGLSEIRDKFGYHRIDDMEVVIRLSFAQIALVTDRVGLQVRLEKAVMVERRLAGFEAHQHHREHSAGLYTGTGTAYRESDHPSSFCGVCRSDIPCVHVVLDEDCWGI